MPLESNVYFEQCIDFLARMIEKYGDSIELPDSDTRDNTQDTSNDNTSVA